MSCESLQPVHPVQPVQSLQPAHAARQARDVAALVARIAAALLHKNLRLVTAESCTGGLIAAACTDLAGSSAWFERGFVTYSNAAKTDSLGVGGDIICRHGAVSAAVVRAMALGALVHTNTSVQALAALAEDVAHVALAVTGVAGPGGGSAEKPVGTVWFGWSVCGVLSAECQHFAGDRAAVRAAAVQHALARLATLLGG